MASRDPTINLWTELWREKGDDTVPGTAEWMRTLMWLSNTDELFVVKEKQHLSLSAEADASWHTIAESSAIDSLRSINHDIEESCDKESHLSRVVRRSDTVTTHREHHSTNSCRLQLNPYLCFCSVNEFVRKHCKTFQLLSMVTHALINLHVAQSRTKSTLAFVCKRHEMLFRHSNPNTFRLRWSLIGIIVLAKQPKRQIVKNMQFWFMIFFRGIHLSLKHGFFFYTSGSNIRFAQKNLYRMHHCSCQVPGCQCNHWRYTV